MQVETAKPTKGQPARRPNLRQTAALGHTPKVSAVARAEEGGAFVFTARVVARHPLVVAIRLKELKLEQETPKDSFLPPRPLKILKLRNEQETADTTRKLARIPLNTVSGRSKPVSVVVANPPLANATNRQHTPPATYKRQQIQRDTRAVQTHIDPRVSFVRSAEETTTF